MSKISIVVPTIRTYLWDRFADSIPNSCKKHEWELILVGPFKNNEFLEKHSNVRWIKSFANPTTCFQIGVADAKNPILLFSSDDSVFYENAIDICVDDWNSSCNPNDAINCRYREGNNFGLYEYSSSYWKAGTYPTVYGQKYINPSWNIALQTVCSRRFFIDFGGFDCSFQFSNHAHADYSFRVQNLGGRVFLSRVEIANLSHMPGDTGDHAPVKSAQEIDDAKIFDEIWNNQPNRKFIDFNNYLQYADKIWAKRFDKEYSSYQEMCNAQNYR